MFEIFLVSSWDTSHSQFGTQNQILVSCGYRDTANVTFQTHHWHIKFMNASLKQITVGGS
jgi:hypothetical protein